MALLCQEVVPEESFTTVTPDPVLLDDQRVLQNLLDAEDKYVITSSYFKCVQNDIKPHMRATLAAWMLEVAEDQKCEDGVFSLAMNYLDRFLSLVRIKRMQLQLLGSVCLFLASKMKDSKPISAEKLCMYTANSITIREVTSWEQLVIDKLKWDLWAITPHDFLAYILRRLPFVSNDPMVKRHAQTFMTLCATDFKFSMHSPSIIAAASIGTAIKGLMDSVHQRTSFNQILARLHDITHIETDVLHSCLEQIEEMVALCMASAQNPVATSSKITSKSEADAMADKLVSHESPDMEYTLAETPTDVLDVVPLLDYYSS